MRGVLLGLFLLLPSGAAAADAHWIRARLGAFEAISDDGRKPATQALSQFEQFSFALGTIMGKPELQLDPPLRILVFRSAQDLAAQCGGHADALIMGRDRLMACATAEGQLPAPLLGELTRTLLQKNFGRLPPPIESGLEAFFSTLQSSAVRVTWGAPPPAAERTRDWAVLHRIITNPDYTNKAKIYIENLAGGMDFAGAIRNAFGEDASQFNKETDDYIAAGHFATSQAPSRPLNPDRDFSTSVLTSDEGELMRADLLTPASEAIYQSLLKAGKRVPEANEGLAMLAIRAKDRAKAREYMSVARKAGTKNYVALTDYAEIEDDVVDGPDAAREALTINPNYAKAHWVLGEKITEPARRAPEWKIAVGLEPSNVDWAAEYAQLCLDLKQYAEAGRAWTIAAQAAPTPELREKYLALREGIEQQRLDAEDEARRKDAEEKARELARLKLEAQKNLADLEARINKKPLTAAEAANTVDWFDASADETVEGTLLRVDCAGRGLRLSVKETTGKVRVLVVPDTKQFLIQGDEKTLSCGAQPPKQVSVAVKTSKAAGKSAPDEATGIEFH